MLQLTAHDALSALINLSSDIGVVGVMSRDDFLTELIVASKLLPPNQPKSSTQTATTAATDAAASQQQTTTHRIDNLLEIFVRGETSKYNPSANFHFLAGVFANLSTTPQGCEFFLSRSTVDNTLRLSKIVVFTQHSDVMRRGGSVSTIKNCCFGASVADMGQDILFGEELGLLVQILLPLSGSEDYTDEEMDGMPDELQFLESTKQREPDQKIRLMLVEILVLLTSTRFGRDVLRSIKAYPVVQKLHLVERSEEIQIAIETFVNMIMRDEADHATDEAARRELVKEEQKRLQSLEQAEDADAEIEPIV
eukprot:jgi/Hompol1/5721/HPOL_002038-RA